MRGAWRSMLLLGALCAVCGASVAIAFAAPSRTPRASARGRAGGRATATSATAARRRVRRRPHGTSTERASDTKQPTPVAGAQSPTHAQDTPRSTVPTAATPGSTAASPSGPNGSEEAVTVKPRRHRHPLTWRSQPKTAKAFRFVLSRSSVPAGRTIIEFVNHGQDEHNLNAAEGSEGEVVGSLPNTPSNDHLSLTVNLKPGSYTLFCSLPRPRGQGHESDAHSGITPERPSVATVWTCNSERSAAPAYMSVRSASAR